jgi:hypothetical protein
MTIEEVENVDHFVNNLENIETPSQLVAGLRDPLLQKFLLLNTSADLSSRLDFWLLRSFEEELETLREGFGLSTTLSELLAAVVNYTESSKVFLRSISVNWSVSANSRARLFCQSHNISLQHTSHCGMDLQISGLSSTS